MIGQENNHEPDEHSGTGLVTEANQDRAGLLEELFGVLPSASTADKALINQNFATPEGERRLAHSPLLQKKVAAARHLADEPTLTERVRLVAGRP
jgi:hypothetical protein